MNEFANPPMPNPAPPGNAVPSSPKVFGVLSIIFAGLMLLVNLPVSCMGLFASSVTDMGSALSAQAKAQDAEAVGAVIDMVGSIYRVMGIQGVIMLAMSGVLLAIGIGQLKYRRWAAKWSFVWGCVGLGALGLMACLYIFVVGPAYEEMFKILASADPQAAEAAEMMSGLGNMMGGWSSVFQIIFLAPYPILMIVFFRKPAVIQAMNQ